MKRTLIRRKKMAKKKRIEDFLSGRQTIGGKKYVGTRRTVLKKDAMKALEKASILCGSGFIQKVKRGEYKLWFPDTKSCKKKLWKLDI